MKLPSCTSLHMPFQISRLWKWFLAKLHSNKDWPCFPIWIFMYSFRCPDCENTLLQFVQEKGCSPVWIFMYFLSDQIVKMIYYKLYKRKRPLSCMNPHVNFQNLQIVKMINHKLCKKKGRSPVWIFMCTLKVPDSENDLPQVVQE